MAQFYVIVETGEDLNSRRRDRTQKTKANIWKSFYRLLPFTVTANYLKH